MRGRKAWRRREIDGEREPGGYSEREIEGDEERGVEREIDGERVRGIVRER